jgi:hypothetical protein
VLKKQKPTSWHSIRRDVISQPKQNSQSEEFLSFSSAMEPGEQFEFFPKLLEI